MLLKVKLTVKTLKKCSQVWENDIQRKPYKVFANFKFR